MSENNLRVTYEATLDIVTYDKKVTPVVKVTQGDTCTRIIHAVVKKNGEIFDVDGSYTVSANFRRADQSTGVYEATAEADGSITCVIPVWALEVPGDAYCDFTISYTDGGTTHKLTTPDTLIKVIRACAPNGASAS